MFLEALSALALRALKHIAVERGTTQSRGSSARTPGRPDAPSASPQPRQARSFFGSKFCAWDARQSSRLLNFGFRARGRPMSKLPGSDKLPTRLGNFPGSSSFRKPPEALGGSGKLPAGFGKPCKAPGRLINQEPQEKRCKEPYKVTPSAKPTFREVRGHKIYRNI